jgi:cephalosporin hydroxylase
MSTVKPDVSYCDQIYSSKALLCIGLITFSTFYAHYRLRPKLWNDCHCPAPSSFQAKEQLHTTEITYNYYENETLLLQNCSTSAFVSRRARKRILADKNAVFVQGDRVIDLGHEYFISVDDILYGYDVLFEKDVLFSAGSWLGVQFQSSPQDAIIFQQLIWKIKPDLIIDFGTNAGGSALFFASMMSFYADAGVVLTIDIKPFTENAVPKEKLRCKDCVIPSENRLWKKYVQFIQGSTTDAKVIAQVKQYASNSKTILISHDSSHDSYIVYQDLLNFAHLVSINSYFVVQDTKLDRLLNPYNGPLTAVRQFLEYQNKTQQNLNYTFEVDRSVEIFYYSQHAHGWLKRTK